MSLINKGRNANFRQLPETLRKDGRRHSFAINAVAFDGLLACRGDATYRLECAREAPQVPYVIRSRFIFAAAHLSHQANQSKAVGGWKDDLPLDGEINFSEADATGAPWRAWSKLKPKLERIGNRTYQARTANFRNLYNHRFSPRIVFGQATRALSLWASKS